VRVEFGLDVGVLHGEEEFGRKGRRAASDPWHRGTQEADQQIEEALEAGGIEGIATLHLDHDLEKKARVDLTLHRSHSRGGQRSFALQARDLRLREHPATALGTDAEVVGGEEETPIDQLEPGGMQVPCFGAPGRQVRWRYLPDDPFDRDTD
jgi:hypothetical protein